MQSHFATVKRPGHRAHEMRVVSAHATAEAARKAANKDKSLCVISTVRPVAKGGVLWDDAAGRTGWASV